MNIKKSENKNGNCGQCLNPQTMYQINIKIDLSYDPYNIGDIVCNFRVDVKIIFGMNNKNKVLGQNWECEG